MSQFLKRIIKARPGAQVAVIGDDIYDNIDWGGEAPIPEATLLEQDAAIAEDDARALIPRSVSMRQARLALMGAGLLQAVNDAVAAMPGVEGDAARIEWEYALSVERNSPLVSGLSASLELTAEQLDALFTAAAVL